MSDQRDDDKPDERLIRNKERVAETRAARGKGLAQEKILGSGPSNRHGMPKLPPGQHEVKDWPVLDLGVQPRMDLKRWRLEVCGLIERPTTLTWDDFLALEQSEDISDFHCVTTWSRYDNRWSGVRLSHLLNKCGLKPDASHVYFYSYDDYTTNIPLTEALKDDVLLVHTWEGQPLPREHGGPCRVITPQLYAWKGAKWVKKIEVMAADRL